MADTTFGQAGKTGTVYGGPAPAATGTVYSGPAPAGGTTNGGSVTGGTVYNGGTVYKGPAEAATASLAGARSIGIPTNPVVSKGTSVFLAIAIVTGVKAMLAYSGVSFAIAATDQVNPVSPLALLLANLAAAGIFLLLWAFARRGSKAAFVIGMLLYGLDLVLLLAAGPAEHIPGIVVHGLFLYYLFSGFRQLA